MKYYKNNGETRQILYSTDEGQTFNAHNFTNVDLRMYGLMTEPGGNTTVFTMFGSGKPKHQWIIVKVDMKNAFSECLTLVKLHFLCFVVICLIFLIFWQSTIALMMITNFGHLVVVRWGVMVSEFLAY